MRGVCTSAGLGLHRCTRIEIWRPPGWTARGRCHEASSPWRFKTMALRKPGRAMLRCAGEPAGANFIRKPVSPISQVNRAQASAPERSCRRLSR